MQKYKMKLMELGKAMGIESYWRLQFNFIKKTKPKTVTDGLIAVKFIERNYFSFSVKTSF